MSATMKHTKIDLTSKMPAARRLALYKAKAADWKEKLPDMKHYHDWRHWAKGRAHTTKRGGGVWQALEDIKRHASMTTRAYWCDNWPAGWRQIGNADQVWRGIKHTGWYTDPFGDTGTLRGFVLQLPARKGIPCFIPATYHTDWDGVTLYPLDTFEDKEDAARAADRYAELAAEKEREYQTEHSARIMAEELREEACNLRTDMLALLAELKPLRKCASNEDAGKLPHTCKTLHAQVSAMLAAIYAKREKAARLIAEPWTITEA